MEVDADLPQWRFAVHRRQQVTSDGASFVVEIREAHDDPWCLDGHLIGCSPRLAPKELSSEAAFEVLLARQLGGGNTASFRVESCLLHLRRSLPTPGLHGHDLGDSQVNLAVNELFSAQKPPVLAAHLVAWTISGHLVSLGSNLGSLFQSQLIVLRRYRHTTGKSSRPTNYCTAFPLWCSLWQHKQCLGPVVVPSGESQAFRRVSRPVAVCMVYLSVIYESQLPCICFLQTPVNTRRLGPITRIPTMLCALFKPLPARPANQVTLVLHTFAPSATDSALVSSL